MLEFAPPPTAIAALPPRVGPNCPNVTNDEFYADMDSALLAVVPTEDEQARFAKLINLYNHSYAHAYHT